VATLPTVFLSTIHCPQTLKMHVLENDAYPDGIGNVVELASISEAHDYLSEVVVRHDTDCFFPAVQELNNDENANSTPYPVFVPSSYRASFLPITAGMEPGFRSPRNKNCPLNVPSFTSPSVLPVTNLSSAWVEPFDMLTGAGFGGSIVALNPDATNSELQRSYPESSSELLAVHSPLRHHHVDLPLNEEGVDSLDTVITRRRSPPLSSP